jgi:hypothetical protein
VRNQQPTPGEWVILAGAGVTIVGSFLDATISRTAWSSTSFSTLKVVPLYAIAVAALIAVQRFARAELPDRVAGLAWPQLYLVASFFTLVMAVAWFVAIEDRRSGLYAMTLGAFVMTVGAFILERNRARREPRGWDYRFRSATELTAANVVILVAGALVLLGSFLPFYKISMPDLPLGDLGPGALGLGDITFTAWSRDLYYPVTIIPVLCGVVMALLVVLSTVLKLPLPSRVGSFAWNQVHLVLGCQAAIMMVAFLLENRRAFELGAGFLLMLGASIALVVGAVMRMRDVATAT